MMPPIEHVPSLPKKCPFPTCKAKLHKEWVLGILPKYLGIINVMIRCRDCERVFAFSMPVTIVDSFISSLPKDESGIFRSLSSDKPSSMISDAEHREFKEKVKNNGQKMIKAFSMIEEYDALGYYDENEDDDE